MAAAFKSAGSLVVETATTTLVTSAAPSVVSGDFLLLCVNVIGNTSPGTPSGWTLVGDIGYWSNAGRYIVFRRTADGTSDDAPTLTLGTARNWQAAILCVEGHDGADPYGSNYILIEDQVQPITHPSLTAVADGSLAVISGASYLSEAGTWAFSNGFTPRLTSAGGAANWIATKAVDAGDIGTTDVTMSSTLLRSATFTAIIAPAASSSTVSSEIEAIYRIAGLVDSSALLPYGIASLVVAESTVLYRIAALVQTSAILPYKIAGSVSVDNRLLYKINQLANKDLQSVYKVAGLASADIDLLYDILGLDGVVFADLQCLYSLGTIVAATAETPYKINSLASASVNLLYGIRALVAASESLYYKIFASAGSDLATPFSVHGLAAADAECLYKISQLSHADLQILYRCAVAITGSDDRTMRVAAYARTLYLPGSDRTMHV